MSRHRNVRGLEDDDYDEDDQYGSSYNDDLGYLSKSVEEQYTYNRGQGATPKMSSFLATQVSRDGAMEGAQDEIDFEMEIVSET